MSNYRYLTESGLWEPPALSSERVPGGEPHGDATVLLVDDRWAARSSLATILKQLGYRVTEAEDGIQAHAILGTMQFDAMVLDIRLPGMDGATLLATVPEPPPTIILSATELGDRTRERLAEVVVAELRKPVAPQLLIDTLAVAVGGGSGEP